MLTTAVLYTQLEPALPHSSTAIRQEDADTSILTGGMAYSAVEWLPYVEPTAATRTVYAAHQYQPNLYTHQWWDCQECSYPGTRDTDGMGTMTHLTERRWRICYQPLMYSQRRVACRWQ
jgi:hypothetical protein